MLKSAYPAMKTTAESQRVSRPLPDIYQAILQEADRELSH